MHLVGARLSRSTPLSKFTGFFVYMNLAILYGICIYPTETGQRAFCPECGGAVMSKVGAIKEPHWAHLVETNCEGYYKPMSEWHRSWQEKFPKEWREIFTKKDGEVCIADVKTPRGTTIEFQHSPISKENIAKRKRVHGDVFWVLDGEVYTSGIREDKHYIDYAVTIIMYVRGWHTVKYIEDFCSYYLKFRFIVCAHKKPVNIITKAKKEDYYEEALILDIKIYSVINIEYIRGFMNDILFDMSNNNKSLLPYFYFCEHSIDRELKWHRRTDFNIFYTYHSFIFNTDFFNSNGVFIDKAKGVPDDSLLQVFKDGTFKIFKKEGFIEKLLSHAQTKTN